MKLHQKLFWLLILLLPVQLGRHFWPDWSYVWGLKIDYLSPTLYLTDILVGLILFFWFLEKPKIIKSLILNLKSLFFVSIFCFLLLNCFLAQNQQAAFYKLIKIVELFLLALYIVKNHYSLSNIRRPLALAVIYSSLIAIVQFIHQGSLGGIFYWLGERAFSAATPGIAQAVINGELVMRPYATFPHPNVLAGFVLVSLILTLPLFRSRLFTICYSLFTVAVMTICFSRAALMSSLFLVFFWIFKKKKMLLTLGYLLVATILIIFSFRFSTSENFLQRIDLAQVALQIIRQQPLIGVGLNNFLVHLPSFHQSIGQVFWWQPVHNIYLLAATETGLVGLLIFLWFLFLTFKKLLAATAKRQALLIRWPLIAALSVILLTGALDHYWLTLQQPQLLFAIVLGLSWGSGKSKMVRGND